MSNISVDYDILNQKQTPAFYASSLATRPAFGFPGRIFIDTDTPSSGIYRDTGSAWVQVADPGAGTTGTLQQVTTNGNTTTLAIQVQGIDFSDGAGTGLYNIAIGNQTMGANTTGNYNIAIGYQNLKFNTTGALNVAVGNTALVNNTTGSQNTAVGQLALNLNTTGSQNTALGNATLENNTTGTSNTAIGHASLVANTTGNNNVGIGNQSLNVNTTGLQNTAVGVGALAANTTASSNTAIGFNSLAANTTGVSNTAIGNQALFANSTGGSNTAIGIGALQNNTTANSNTAIGSSALQNNSTGTQNTAIGTSALSLNTTAAGNTSIGFTSLQNNTTGANNTAVGQSSLTANTTGFSNVGIGSRALTANTTGAQNVAIGTDALYINTTGNTNTAIGTAALSLNTTGGGNTAIGVSALNSNTTANYNTAVGSSSLAGNTTGTANTALGYQSLNANTTGNNNTAIGYGSLLVNTGAGNTGIGYGSLSSNTSGGNNTALGNSALIGSTTASSNTAIGTSALTSATTGGQNTAIGINAGSNISTGTNNSFLGISAGVGITTGSNNTIIGNAGTLSATLTSNIILADGGGNVRLFSDANGLIGINQAVGSTIGGQLDIHTTQTYALVLNGLSTSNAYTAFSNASVGKWRIGNTYNAGANSFDIFNLDTSAIALSISSVNNIGINTITPNFASIISGVGVLTIAPKASERWGSLELAGNRTAGGNQVGVLYFTNINTANSISASIQVYNGASSVVPGNMGFFTNNGTTQVQNATIFSSGNVAIGSTTDDTINKLQVNGSAKFTSTIQANSATLGGIISSKSNGTLGAIRITKDSYNRFTIEANDSSNMYNFDNDAGTLRIFTDSYNATGVGTGGSIKFSLDSTGIATINNLAGTGSRAVLADANGVLSAPVSDISVKENINTIGYGLNEILKMNPVWFDYIDEYKNFGEGRQNGNIAQEMEAIIPEAVFTTPSTGKMGINYDQLHAVYIKAIQELKAEIDALKNN